MRATRILVDTCKGAFVLTSDAQRETWSVAVPFSEGGKYSTPKDVTVGQLVWPADSKIR